MVPSVTTRSVNSCRREVIFSRLGLAAMRADRTAHSIFLSYSSQTRDLARVFVEALEGQYGSGAVWWDHALESWGDYEVQIRNALHQARVVVVLWCASAAASDWVKSEAGRANRDHKLVSIRSPDTSWRDIPSPYDQHHVNELQDTPGILRSIDAVWTGRPVRTAVPLHEIYFRQHGQRLIDPKQRTLPRDPRDIGPSELLQAPYEVVGYVDVSDVQARFFDWCTQPGRPTAGRLIHGPGGLGKTRLMVSLAARVRSQGWTAGFLDRPRDSAEPTLKQRWQALEQLIDHGDDRGLLIVIDYAEARQDEVRALAQRLCERPDAEARPVRLVLLARSAGEWWTTLHADTPDIQRVFRGDDPASAIELPAVSSGALRLALFEASVEAFHPWLDAQGATGVTGPGTPSKAYLTQIETAPAFSRPLAIQMAALAWLTSSAKPGADADPTSVEELLRRVLGLERDHWRKILGDLDDEHRRDLGRAVAQVALVGGTSTPESTERLLMADEFYRGRRMARVDVDAVRRQLALLYGGLNGGIAPLEPDLIAEHHVASVGDKELVDSCMRWAERETPDEREPRWRYVLTVLQRATQVEHGPDVRAQAVALLEHLVESHSIALAAAIVAVMVNEPGALVSVLDRSVDRFGAKALKALHDVLPGRSLVLLDVSLKIAVRGVGLARDELARASSGQKVGTVTEAERDLISRLVVLGIRLSNLGRREEALTASQEAIAIHHRLAKVLPDPFLPGLAVCLNNLSADLSSLGRREEALAASQQVVEIRRRLAEARPDAFLPPLASALSNVGSLLARLGRNEEALAASREAVEIQRRLAEVRPDKFLPNLANSLNGLGHWLCNLGRREEALATSQEAVTIFRGLAEARPDTFLPDLAMSLTSLGIRLSGVTRHEEALATSHEAVGIYRRLAAAHPDAFLPELASSVNNLAIRLWDLELPQEALAPCQEAVTIRRQLAEVRPDAFLPDLAASIGVLSKVLAELDRHAEAAGAAHQALEILAPFVERQPAAFGGLARVTAEDLLRYSEASSKIPDFELVERIVRALGNFSPSE
jgi:tetratricopeptide (TPR) repeat protein